MHLYVYCKHQVHIVLLLGIQSSVSSFLSSSIFMIFDVCVIGGNVGGNLPAHQMPPSYTTYYDPGKPSQVQNIQNESYLQHKY